MPTPRQPLVAVLAMPESSASVLYGMYDVFLSAGRDWDYLVAGAPGTGAVRTIVVAARTESFKVLNGVSITPEASLDEIPIPDVVCVPDLAVDPLAPIEDGRFAREVAWLRRCHAGGAILASACSGTVLLAETGLLDGCDATTHWAYAAAIAQRHPRVRMRTQSALIVAGEGHRLVMAGGGTSWSDLTLYLIARLTGVERAMQAARMNLIEWHAVGQQPYARLARTPQAADAVIARCQVWIAEHYAIPSPVAAMARLSALAERTFKRRFQKATGLAPLEYVHTLRLEEAKQMLEAGNESVEAIANAVGYEDAGFFGRLFRRKVGLSPLQYRRRFGAMRSALAEK
ncbi:GlxA family transcriptional regulator [Solimonas variicoloris]|uniref:GlxA family transcriptional regulator n=1 Tax=Solimonas variicoloris TaxID=254408 RepID=UPI00047660C6|nr:helix-turn-helix domain-containing protein [Solimonas variicoloris]